MPDPNCPACGSEPAVRRSPLVYRGLMIPRSPSSFFEDGEFHYHDTTPKTALYKCPEGHYWVVRRLQRCGACDFGNEEARVEDVTYSLVR